LFSHNSAEYGGAICAGFNTLSLSGTNEFSHNSAQYGGAIYTE